MNERELEEIRKAPREWESIKQVNKLVDLIESIQSRDDFINAAAANPKAAKCLKTLSEIEWIVSNEDDIIS